MALSIIVCTDLNGGIGADGELLAHIPSDLNHFKNLTLYKPCVMGRKTFQSIINKNGRPLPNRLSVVVTSRFEEWRELYLDYPFQDEVVFTDDIQTIIELSKGGNGPLDEVMVCGGESIYKQFLPYCDKLYISTIMEEFDSSDTFFPLDYVDNEFIPIETDSIIDSESGYGINFTIYKRNKGE